MTHVHCCRQRVLLHLALCIPAIHSTYVFHPEAARLPRTSSCVSHYDLKLAGGRRAGATAEASVSTAPRCCPKPSIHFSIVHYQERGGSGEEEEGESQVGVRESKVREKC
eukprot:2722900-Rhodomonas_salina.2